MKISVVLCTYNGAKYLKPQIESILQQTRLPDELLICDDGSKDQTIELVRTFGHPAIRIIQNTVNLGVIKNFEQAIQQASGDVIFLSDQDDMWFPERIATMIKPFENDPESSMVYCNFTYADQNLQPKAITYAHRWVHEKGIPRTPQQIIKTWGTILGCTMAIRASIRPLLFPIPSGWEHDNWIQIMAFALGNVKNIPEPLMYYRLHGGSSSGNLKHEITPAQEVRITIGMTKLKFYADERIRWQSLVQHLKKILAQQEISFLKEFLPEAERRSELATRREEMRLNRHWQRMIPALKLLLRGDYHRYMRGFKTFAKDVLIR